MAGLPEFLDYLVAHKIPINIATGADKGNVNFYLKYLHLDKWFDPQKDNFFRWFFSQVNPVRTIYIMAAERIGVNIKDCLVFEDAWLGVQAAKKCRS
jgi:beta-phosphoglucomutase-like phosphatase (HAD superfamily)